MTNQRNRIAAAIRAARRAKGLSQEALAERVSVAAEHVSALERGVNTPSLETFTALAVELGLDATRLLIGTKREGDIAKERHRLEAEVIALAEAFEDAALAEWLEIGRVLAKRGR